MNTRVLVLFGLFLSLIGFAALEDLHVNYITYAGGTFLVHGNISSPNVNVSVSILENLSYNASNVSNETTYLVNMYLTAPTIEGDYTIYIKTNESTNTHYHNVTVTNVSGVTSSVLGSPTYATGTTFRVNLTLTNGSANALQNYPSSNIGVMIFSPNGGQESWVIVNESAKTNANGNIVYNITIPQYASGSYILVVKAATPNQFFFNVKPSGNEAVKFTVYTKTQEGVNSHIFGVNENVTIEANLRLGNNLAITGASVSAYVQLPNKTVTSLTLVESGDGIYQANYTTTSAGGNYYITAKAVYGSYTYKIGSLFTVGTVAVDLIADEDMFFHDREKGGKEAIKPGSEVGFIVLVKNLSSDKFIAGSSDGSVTGTINCSKISLISLKTIDGAGVAVSTFSKSTEKFFGEDMCFVNFTAPSTSGVYVLTINVTAGSSTAIGVTTFHVQSFMLRIMPLSTFGGGENFHQMFKPGSNVTFTVRAINSSDHELDKSNVNNISVIELYNLPNDQSINVATLSKVVDNINDRVQITMPTSPTDAFILTVSANVTQGATSEIVSGDTFFFSKYVVGNFMPAAMGDPGGGKEENIYAGCKGTEVFIGNAMVAETGESVKAGALWLNAKPQIVIQESTGKLITNCINFTENSSDTNGDIATIVTFNPACTFSGAYFFMANVTYTDENGAHKDNLPGFFMCNQMKGQVLFSSADPTAQQIGEGPKSLSSTGNITVNVTGLKYLNGSTLSSGTVQITEMHAFEGYGPPKFFKPANSLIFSFTNGNTLFNLSLQNFTLSGSTPTKWAESEGWLEATIIASDGAGTSSTFIDGIQIDSPIEVFTWFKGSTFVIGENITVNLYAKTNITPNACTVSFERPGSPGGVPAKAVVQTLLVDGWNVSGHPGFEQWQLNITVPTIQKGDARAIITCYNNLTGEKIKRDIFGFVQGVAIGIPKAGIPLWKRGGSGSTLDQAFNTSLENEGWNLTWIAQNFSYTLSDFVCYMPNVSISYWIGHSEITTLINATTKLLVVDSNNDSRSDTVLLRNTLIPNSSKNASAFTIVNSTNKNMGYGLYMWDIHGCGYVKIIRTQNISSSDLSNARFAEEYGVNQNITLPYVVLRGSTPVSGVTVNITSIYTENQIGWGIGSQLPYTSYTIVPALTDANGIAWLTMNISTAGRYRMFWRVNGTFNDSATMGSDSQIEIRRIKGYGKILHAGMAPIIITNTSGGAGDLMCPGGGCYEVYNGTTPNFYGIGTLRVALNETNNKLVFNLAGESTTDGPGKSLYINVRGKNYTFAIAAVNSTASTKTWVFYMKHPNQGGQYSPQNNTAIIEVKVCAKNITLSTKGDHAPLHNANITAIWIRQFGFSGPTNIPLVMYSPLTTLNVATIPVLPINGCTAFRVGPSPTWSGHGEIRVNITANISGEIVTEDFHIGMINIGGGSG